MRNNNILYTVTFCLLRIIILFIFSFHYNLFNNFLIVKDKVIINKYSYIYKKIYTKKLNILIGTLKFIVICVYVANSN